MREAKYYLGFANGHFFVGYYNEDTQCLDQCLVMVFNDGERGVTTNFVNPIPFSFTKDKEMYLTSIPTRNFLYLVDLRKDIDDGESLIEYYKDSVEYEKSKIQPPSDKSDKEDIIDVEENNAD